LTGLVGTVALCENGNRSEQARLGHPLFQPGVPGNAATRCNGAACPEPAEGHPAARAATVLRHVLPLTLCTSPLIGLPNAVHRIQSLQTPCDPDVRRDGERSYPGRRRRREATREGPCKEMSVDGSGQRSNVMNPKQPLIPDRALPDELRDFAMAE